MKVMQIQFWSDALDMTGSVGKVIDGFSYMDDPEIELVIASLGNPSADCIKNGKRFVHFEESKWQNKIFNKILGLKAFTYPDLLKIIEKERPDILHFHNRSNLIDSIVNKLSYRPRILVHCHRKFENFHIPNYDCNFIAISEYIKNFLIDVGVDRKKIHTIYNPIPQNYNTSPCSRNVDFSKNKMKIIYAGGGSTNKGYNQVIKAFSQDLGIFKKIELHICGPGLPNDCIKKDWIFHHGYLNNQEFNNLLCASDVVLMPSRFEGLGLVALEAIQARKILISTRDEGLGEIIPPNWDLYLKDNSSESILEALINLIYMDIDRINLIKIKQLDLISKFDIKKILTELAVIYKGQ